ncbi:hypothetical protein ZIOFF_057455 [Zingiber officinale]|uniref:Uncharacterized protein n=1 Tax=Zingiber officinale TaxID=94328 RepID=A0A8J5F2Q1_ZINOF|nr:hypothetical protein ZIOFF_057455 [Zingiber officinale]
MTSLLSHLVSLAFFISFILLFSSASSNEERKVYIVYMGAQHSSQYPTYELHLNLLKEIFVNCSPSESLVYSYQRSFSGFAAKLSIDEAEKLNDMEGIVSVFPSKTLKLRTTRSWDFLNFSQRVNRNPTLESDIIIGMIDTGIWPESKSFSGQGLRPPPRKWKGACVNMTCNNLGDYMFSEPSPRDFQGHGTHTASIAAGRTVSHASLYGLAKGMARGAVPSARLAVYKVCWWFGCTDQDILAAFDDAISDGVDIISLSVAYAIAADYFQDSIAIGAFHAMANGILTSTAAGNAGPYRGTVSNVAPWTLVAAASSIDRHIIDKVVTGNHVSTLGASVNTFATKNRDDHPLIYMQGNATILPGDCTALPDINMVKGKIVLCKYFYDEIFTKPMYPSARQDELSYGAGQLNPVKAVDPGLVYDAGASDYVQMLCNSAYNETMIKMVTGDASSCSASSKGTVRDLNYPSMALHVQSGKAFAAKFLRTVTNVGGARRCRYKAEVWADHRLNVAVNPSKLKFSELKEKRQFTVSVSGGPLPGNSTAPATVIWSDGEHQVRSVMVVYTD